MKRLSAADGLTVTCFCFYFMKLRRSKCLAGAVEGGAQCSRAALECSASIYLCYVLRSPAQRRYSRYVAVSQLSLISVKSSLYPVFIISNDIILCKLYTN